MAAAAEQTENRSNNDCFDQDSAVDTSLSSTSTDSWDTLALQREIQRLRQIRNVGIFAHVDAGKTTVTERMLALAGVVHRAGSVDDGNTVTDYLPAERERGITISSAAISFPWAWHNRSKHVISRESNECDDGHVTISLIDTPGHVDFSVEVNRSVAVLDGAVLLVDAVAGVQAQTETVWRAMTRPSLNNHSTNEKCDHAHEPLPCVALVNKMDKEGCHFGNAVRSLKAKLPGANPIPIQLPLFRGTKASTQGSYFTKRCIEALPIDDTVSCLGEFVGVIDLVHMRAVVYPEKCSNVANVESCIPDVVPLLRPKSNAPIDDPTRILGSPRRM
jgi:elongation factor G